MQVELAEEESQSLHSQKSPWWRWAQHIQVTKETIATLNVTKMFCM